MTSGKPLCRLAGDWQLRRQCFEFGRHDQRQFWRGRCELLVDWCVQPVFGASATGGGTVDTWGIRLQELRGKSNDGYYCTSGQSNADYFKLAAVSGSLYTRRRPRRPVPACSNPLRWRLRVSRWQVFRHAALQALLISKNPCGVLPGGAHGRRFSSCDSGRIR